MKLAKKYNIKQLRSLQLIAGGGASVSFINWWAGSYELLAQAKLAVGLTIASTADFCGYLWCVRVRARCYVPAPLRLKRAIVLVELIFRVLSKIAIELQENYKGCMNTINILID